MQLFLPKIIEHQAYLVHPSEDSTAVILPEVDIDNNHFQKMIAYTKSYIRTLHNNFQWVMPEYRYRSKRK